MIKSSVNKGLCLLMLLFGLAATAIHASEAFNFAYRSSGESDLKPLQVFDDGHSTYLQMKGSLVPAVLVNDDGKQVMLQVKRSGQYLIVQALAPEMTLQFANLKARVVYTGVGRQKAVLGNDAVQTVQAAVAEVTAGALSKLPIAAPTAYGPVRPTLGDQPSDSFIDRDALVGFPKGSSTLSKEAAARIVQALAGSGTVAKLTITGRDDQFYVEGLARARGIAIRDRAIAAGVPLENIVVREGVARDGEAKVITSDVVVTWRTAKPKEEVLVSGKSSDKWNMEFEDKVISTTLSKWASSQGWSLIWKAGQDIAITGNATLVAPTMLEAVKVVVAQANKIGYPLTMETHNKVLTIK